MRERDRTRLDTSSALPEAVGRTVARQVERGGFRLMATRYVQGARMPAHEHERPSLCLLLHGRCRERRDGAERELVGPSLTLNLPSTGHEFHVVEGAARCFAVEASMGWLSDFAQAAEVSPRPVLDSGEPGSLSFTLGLYEELLRPDDLSATVVEEQLVAALEGLLGTEGRGGGRPPSWLRRAREILDDEAPSAPGLSELAELVGVHRVHLAQSFRRFYGSSVGEYARMLRLRRAQREIANSVRPLGEIALRAGFYDQSHLNRRFRRAMGMTPGRFRCLAGRG